MEDASMPTGYNGSWECQLICIAPLNYITAHKNGNEGSGIRIIAPRVEQQSLGVAWVSWDWNDSSQTGTTPPWE